VFTGRDGKPHECGAYGWVTVTSQGEAMIGLVDQTGLVPGAIVQTEVILVSAGY
jgi:hypothetical protein